MRDIPYIASVLFTCVKLTRVRTLKLRDSGNPKYDMPKISATANDAHRSKTSLTNGKAANWAPEVGFSPFRALSRLQESCPAFCYFDLSRYIAKKFCGWFLFPVQAILSRGLFFLAIKIISLVLRPDRIWISKYWFLRRRENQQQLRITK